MHPALASSLAASDPSAAWWPATWIDHHATGRNALIATGLVIGLTVAFAAAGRLLRLDTGNPVGGIGIRSPARLAAAAAKMSQAERRGRVLLTLTLDLVYPLAYGAALAFASAVLLARLSAPAPLRLLRLVPLGAVALDYAENVCIALLLGARVKGAAVPLAGFTPGKWLLVFISIGVLGVAGAWLLARKLGGRG
jgi:hypothetical protein